MNNHPKTIELLFKESQENIAVPSRDQFKLIFNTVTNNSQVRYTSNEMSFVRKWMHRVERINRAILVSLVTSIALVVIVIVPQLGSSSITTVSDEIVNLEAMQELSLINQEDVLIDQVVEKYFDQLINASIN
jgi:hypothetical protein